ncbi:PREDICTED: uncharacterized protein LOC104825914 [Tarenaya hassleriana]|uniref:uncharacterized protein LOC104825914 n=1 Tax=Tarenaya hassleriana TaxID=28532 RepID=UPI00053C51CC|nr:PREDICTED: uncharacterized protein LOC104825914 [Tarenaya hassleriana]
MMSSKWEMEDSQLTFFKCTRWQLEETLDPINCPFHYFCDSIYAGDYPPITDILVFFFVSFAYMATLIIIITSTVLSRRENKAKRYLLPSGPIFLPVILLILAKGQRINTLFPVSSFGPAILQLVQVSALVFKNKIDKEVNYVFFEASTISGVLHASLYLDAVILPYYTGFDALIASTFSSVCKSCICRQEALVVGGKFVAYRAWSTTTFLVVGVLCMRIMCRLCRDEAQKKRIFLIRITVEGLAWVSLIRDGVYLAVRSPVDELMLFRVYVFGSVLLLICLHVIAKLCCLVSKRERQSANTRI